MTSNVDASEPTHALSPDVIRLLLQVPVTDAEAEAVIASYSALSRAVSTFPLDRLRDVEPALRSTPGPSAA